jgi:hypothetical protein
MSQRSLIEINHDLSPQEDEESLLAFARSILLYIYSGDKGCLPDCMELKWRRHHSDPCPFDNPLEFERQFPRSRHRPMK